MIISINQPAYLPWLGYFDRIARSDLHVVLDDVPIEQRTRTAFTNRNRIRSEAGWSWLTVPLKTAGLGQPHICEVEIDNALPWAMKHRRSIEHRYARCRHVEACRPLLALSYDKPWRRLNDLLNHQTAWLLDALALRTPLVYASETTVPGAKSERILNICRHHGATVYLSGALGRGYLDAAAFDQAGIEIRYHDYRHPVYPQLHPGFEPFMSVIDLLYNCGPDSLAILHDN